MARTPKPQRDSSDGDPRPRKSRTTTRPKTDLSIFLQYPLGSMNDDAFRAVCDQIRTLLAPRTDLEHRGIDIILWTFERVRKAYAALDQGVPGANQYLKTMLTSFRERQKTFDLLRKIIDSDPENPTLASILLPEAPPNPPVPVASASQQSTKPEPEPVLPPEDPIDDVKDDEVDEIDEIEAAARDWRSRVAMVPSFDARWPVLDQFNLRVDDILSMRDHGVPEDEILDRHPGLTYTDLACCYSCEADGYRGPLEPPYPDDITLVEDDPEAD